MHHIFWIVSFFLLMNPVIELLSPSVPRETRKRGRSFPRRSAKARARAEAYKSMVMPWPASEALAERLDRLQRDKDILDRRIEQLANRESEKSR